MQPTVVQTYHLSPGACWFTGSTLTPAIDTGLEVTKTSRHGRIYASGQVVGNWARMLGWIPPGEANKLKTEAMELHDALADAEEELAHFHNLKDALEAVGIVVGAPATFPRHKGSGWYEMSDGSRQRFSSQEDAATADAALTVEV